MNNGNNKPSTILKIHKVKYKYKAEEHEPPKRQRCDQVSRRSKHPLRKKYMRRTYNVNNIVQHHCCRKEYRLNIIKNTM